MPYTIGQIRICRDCMKEYEYFGAKGGRCHPCSKAHKRACYLEDSKNPLKVEGRKFRAKAAWARNKRVLNDILKACRCKDCREADPRTLAFYDDKLRLLPMGYKVKRCSVESLKQFARTSIVLCYN